LITPPASNNSQLNNRKRRGTGFSASRSYNNNLASLLEPIDSPTLPFSPSSTVQQAPRPSIKQQKKHHRRSLSLGHNTAMLDMVKKEQDSVTTDQSSPSTTSPSLKTMPSSPTAKLIAQHHKKKSKLKRSLLPRIIPGKRRSRKTQVAVTFYDALIKLVVSRAEHTIALALCQSCKRRADIPRITKAIFSMFSYKDESQLVTFLRQLISLEGERLQQASNKTDQHSDVEQAGTLFRSNTLFTATITQWSSQVGAHYLVTVTQPLIKTVIGAQWEVMAVHDSLSATDDDQKTQRLHSTIRAGCDDFLESLTRSLKLVPMSMRHMLNFLVCTVGKQHERTIVAGSFFLRFLCPSLVAPVEKGIWTGGALPAYAKKALMIISRCVQSVAVGVKVQKDSRFASVINQVIDKWQEKVEEFGHALVNPEENQTPLVSSGGNDSSNDNQEQCSDDQVDVVVLSGDDNTASSSTSPRVVVKKAPPQTEVVLETFNLICEYDERIADYVHKRWPERSPILERLHFILAPMKGNKRSKGHITRGGSRIRKTSVAPERKQTQTTTQTKKSSSEAPI